MHECQSRDFNVAFDGIIREESARTEGVFIGIRRVVLRGWSRSRSAKRSAARTLSREQVCWLLAVRRDGAGGDGNEDETHFLEGDRESGDE